MWIRDRDDVGGEREEERRRGREKGWLERGKEERRGIR